MTALVIFLLSFGVSAIPVLIVSVLIYLWKADR